MPRSLRLIFNGSQRSGIRFAAIDKTTNSVISVDYQSKSVEQIKGNIYVASVLRIEPSLQAAFIDYGANKQGFISFAEICKNFYVLVTDGEKEFFSNLLSEENSDFIISRLSKKIFLKDLAKVFSSGKITIKDILFLNMQIIVQAIKEGKGNKCAVFSTKIRIKGFNVIFMPNFCYLNRQDKKMEKIENDTKIKKIIADLKIKEESSIIINPFQDKIDYDGVRVESMRIIEKWSNIFDKSTSTEDKNGIIHVENDIIERVFKKFNPDVISEIICDDESTKEIVLDRLRDFSLSMMDRLRSRAEKFSYFERLNLDEVFESLFLRKIELLSGGCIVIDITEACVVIDVNSGKMTKNTINVEATALKTNLEAAKKIAEHVKLRNLSGIIVIDFIDMNSVANKKKVESAVKNYFADDFSNVTIGEIVDFGLMHISRQRSSLSFLETSSELCSKCCGSGYNRMPIFSVEHLLRELRKIIRKKSSEFYSLEIDRAIFDLMLLEYHAEWHEVLFKLHKRLKYIISDNIADVFGFSLKAETTGGINVNNHSSKNQKTIIQSSQHSFLFLASQRIEI